MTNSDGNVPRTAPRGRAGGTSILSRRRDERGDDFVMWFEAVAARIVAAGTKHFGEAPMGASFPYRDRLLDAFSDYFIATRTPLYARSEAAVDIELDELLSKAKATRAAIARLSQHAYARLSTVVSGGAGAQEGDVLEARGPDAPEALGRLCFDLTTVISSVHADRRTRSRRRPDRGGATPDHATKQLHRDLVRLYEDATGEQAGMGKQGGKQYVGPFFRFARDCVALLDLRPSNSAFGKALAKAIREHHAVPARKAPPPKDALGKALPQAAETHDRKAPRKRR